MKSIAVVIPVYNGETMIASCLQNVSSAGKRIREIIVVNDGSTDGTWEIIRQFTEKDSRIKAISTRNQGSYMARLTGVRAAESPYVAFLDVDDRFYGGALDQLAELLESTGADVAMGAIQKVFSIDGTPAAVSAADTARVVSSGEIWPRIMKWKTQEFICYVMNKLYKRELFSELLPFDNICQGDDVLITCQAFLSVRTVAETDAPVYLYYQNPASLMHAPFGQRDFDLVRVWDAIVKLFEEKRPDLLFMARFNRWRTDFTLLCRLILADDREKDLRYAEEEKALKASVRTHWKDLTAPHAMPMNRELLLTGLAFSYGPTKAAMRLGGRLARAVRPGSARLR